MWILPRDDRQGTGDVFHGFAEGADLVQGGSKGHQTEARDASVGGLETWNSAEGRRLSNGAAGIRSQSQGHHVCGHGRC